MHSETTSRRTALVADDNTVVRAAVARVVERLGLVVDAVSDGGIAHVRMLTDPPDLLVVDLGLPTVGGMVLIRALRAIRPQASIVAISGLGDDAQHSALAAGADAFLAKPFADSQLAQAITGLLDKPA